MLGLFSNRDYAALFLAQVIALLGTGLLTVALGLLAFDLAGADAGIVLGIAYTIKMVAYVGLAPVAQAIAARLPRKTVLIGADLVRAAAALALPFVTEVWQIYVLIFVLQAASATFTPAYQSVLPDILPDEAQYTRALSLSRLAYDIENVASPAIAGLLLGVTGYSNLFLGTVAGFCGSALLVFRARIPATGGDTARPFLDRVTRGVRLYLATPRLRALLALTFTAAAMSAFVIVNTVVLVRSGYGLDERGLALAMAAYGAGSMAAALLLPRLLESAPDRRLMIRAGFGLGTLTVVLGLAFGRGLPPWSLFLICWAVAGFLYSATLTPSGRLIRRSAPAADRPALFAAYFALSHACWLVTYPLAGWLATTAGAGPTLLALGVLGLIAAALSARLWTTAD